MPRNIQDEEVRQMMSHVRMNDVTLAEQDALLAMLEELLKLREKVRNDAIV